MLKLSKLSSFKWWSSPFFSFLKILIIIIRCKIITKRPTPLPNFKVQKYIKDHRVEDGDDQERNWRCWSLKVGGGSSSIVGSASSLHHPAPSSGNLFDISSCNRLFFNQLFGIPCCNFLWQYFSITQSYPSTFPLSFTYLVYF